MGNNISSSGLGPNRSVAMGSLITFLKVEGYDIIHYTEACSPEPHYVDLHAYGRYQVVYSERQPWYLKGDDIIHQANLKYVGNLPGSK